MVFVFVRQQNRVDMPDPGQASGNGNRARRRSPAVCRPTRAWPKSADGYRGDLSRCRRHTGSRSPALLRSSRAKNYKFHTHRKKTSEFLFFPATGTKIQKNTAEKRNRRFFSHTPDTGAARFTVRSNRLERLSVSFEGRRKRSTIPRVTPAVHTRTIRYLSEKF